ncbi:hypothetical protein PHYC_01721 [Phycisphaerales bacterium]|nr:hypothetical protein PHYC_01721 [Phycisphaerales bacterium]
MPRVFIETTIPSFYFETRTDRRSQDWRDQTRRWWDDHRARYELVTSPLVLLEYRRSPVGKSSEAEQFFARVRLLDTPPEFESVVSHYIQQRLMPADAKGDAAHLAMASLHAADFLLTWNCQHLANANKQRHIRVINERLGLSTPIITTPFELIPE